MTPQTGILWYGKGCSGDERELAKDLAGQFSPRFKDDYEKVLENEEPQVFWEFLGGKADYASELYFEVIIRQIVLMHDSSPNFAYNMIKYG